MALDSEELSVWEIGFRWSGFDPDRIWLQIPLLARDNFRVLMNAILSGEIICTTLCLDKRPPDSKADPRFYIRHYIDDVYACIHGTGFNRKLLKWASLERPSFLEWCQCRGITPPEFWFPPGWKMEFEHPLGIHPGMVVQHEEPSEEGGTHFSYHWPAPGEGEAVTELEKPEPSILRQSQVARVVCQQIARAMWQKDPQRRIADVIRDDLIQEYGGAKFYAEETVRTWINSAAPPEVRERRGRPRKNNSDE